MSESQCPTSGRASRQAWRAYGITKRFGALTVLDGAGLRLAPGDFHALLGGNGAGKSTLVKCIMGYYRADAGAVLIDDREVEIASPREALRLGLGMVYQHFTLVPSMSVLENLVLARAEIPAVLHWRREERALAALMARMPFRVDLGAPVHTLSAGEKQKVEILKQLFLERRIVILDEPTSVLTPYESDEVLGMLQQMTRDGVLSVLLITHKFREVMRFADRYTVLRNGKVTGSGAVGEASPKHLAELMIGNEDIAAPAERRAGKPGETRLEVRGLSLHNERGVPAVRDLSFSIRAGEILGIAGVSGNGQRELVEVLSGSRAGIAGGITAHGAPYRATRREMRRDGVYCLVEEPLKNACVPGMSVAENMALRRFDRAPMSVRGLWLRRSAMTSHARALIERFGVKPPLPEARIEALPAATCSARSWRGSCRRRYGCSSPPTPASASTSPRPRRSGQRSWKPVTRGGGPVDLRGPGRGLRPRRSDRGDVRGAFRLRIAGGVSMGGRATLYGAVVGAIVVNYAKTWMTGALPEVWLFALGALFVLVTVFLPRGIVGLLRARQGAE